MAELLGYALRANPTYGAPVFSLYASLNRSGFLMIQRIAFSSWRRLCPRLLTIFIAVTAAENISAEPFRYQWNIRDIAATDGSEVELRTRDKRLMKRVDTSQMRILCAVKSSIEAVAELSTELIIVDGDQPNAFAGRGKKDENIIGINFAMLDILGLDVHAAAALIGHEIAHLKLHHGEQRSSRENTSGMMKVLGGVALSTLGVPGGSLISDLTITAFETRYSRDHEREADYLGAIWAIEADYEADGAVRLHEAVYSRAKGNSTPFLSSHPSSRDRIATLKALSRRLSP